MLVATTVSVITCVNVVVNVLVNVVMVDFVKVAVAITVMVLPSSRIVGFEFDGLGAISKYVVSAPFQVPAVMQTTRRIVPVINAIFLCL